jgi:hypothetical protein
MYNASSYLPLPLHHQTHSHRIVGGCIIILLIAIIWFFVIVCLKVSGQQKVGFLAGTFIKTTKSLQSSEGKRDGANVEMENENVDEHESMALTNSAEEEKIEKKFNAKVMLARIVFVISGILVIVSGGLFYGKGVASFKSSLNDVRSGIDVSSQKHSASVSASFHCAHFISLLFLLARSRNCIQSN